MELLDAIAARRREIYEFYRRRLEPLEAEGLLRVPHIPENCASNYHLLYILLPNQETRNALMDHLRANGIHAVFHYIPLHSSPMGRKFGHAEGDLPVTEDV